MDDLLEALEDPEFCFFIDDFSYAAHTISWGWSDKPFMGTLVETMKMNSED